MPSYLHFLKFLAPSRLLEPPAEQEPPKIALLVAIHASDYLIS